MRKHANLLTLLVVIALALGVIVGHFFLWDPNATPEAQQQSVQGWKTAGDLIFIRPLMLIVIPLIFTSVLTGITSIGDPKRLGFLGGATLIYYVITMILAVSTGVILASVFEPGANISQEVIDQATRSASIAPTAAAGSVAPGV